MDKQLFESIISAIEDKLKEGYELRQYESYPPASFFTSLPELKKDFLEIDKVLLKHEIELKDREIEKLKTEIMIRKKNYNLLRYQFDKLEKENNSLSMAKCKTCNDYHKEENEKLRKSIKFLEEHNRSQGIKFTELEKENKKMRVQLENDMIKIANKMGWNSFKTIEEFAKVNCENEKLKKKKYKAEKRIVKLKETNKKLNEELRDFRMADMVSWMHPYEKINKKPFLRIDSGF